MDTRSFPTKGNLILAKSSLSLAHLGYDLMDKKRNILIRELMNLIDTATQIQNEIDSVFNKAYHELQEANIDIGISRVRNLSYTIPVDESIKIKTRSIMGVEIPIVSASQDRKSPRFSFYSTKESIDRAKNSFEDVKKLIVSLSMIENSAYRLALSIKKTQKRANALKNITIPYYQNLVKEISNALEEKEREEFSRLKVIKSRQK